MVARWITFQMTADKVLGGAKTVTRREGWRDLRPGDRLPAFRRSPTVRCRACDGSGVLPEVTGTLFAVDSRCGLCGGRGSTTRDPQRFGVIAVVSARVEPLDSITAEECALEGFPHMDPGSFVDLFIRSHPGVTRRGHAITRIEFTFERDEEATS